MTGAPSAVDPWSTQITKPVSALDRTTGSPHAARPDKMHNRTTMQSLIGDSSLSEDFPTECHDSFNAAGGTAETHGQRRRILRAGGEPRDGKHSASGPHRQRR